MFSGPLVRSVVPYVTIFASKINLTKEIISTMIFFIKKYVEWEFQFIHRRSPERQLEKYDFENSTFSVLTSTFICRAKTYVLSKRDFGVRPSEPYSTRSSVPLSDRAHHVYIAIYRIWLEWFWLFIFSGMACVI